MKLKKIILTMIVMSMMNDNCFPLSLEAVKERPKVIDSIVADLEFSGARLAQIPVFKTMDEAINFGIQHFQDKEMIEKLFERAVEYKSVAQMVPTEFTISRYSMYRAAYEMARYGHLQGARLASPITNVVAVGVGNGLNLPYLKEFLEKKGFQNIVLQSIDDGWWMEDESLPKPDLEMRKEMVEIADRTLVGRLGTDEFRIRYVDIFTGLPKEFIGKFDIAFLTPNKANMKLSYIQETMKLLKDYGILIVRLRPGQDMNKPDLVRFCEENDFNISIFDEAITPNPDMEFQDLMLVIQRANFSSKANMSLNLELFRKFLGARLAGMSA